MNQKIQTSIYVQDWSDPEKALQEIVDHNDEVRRRGEDNSWYDRLVKKTAARKAVLAAREAATAGNTVPAVVEPDPSGSPTDEMPASPPVAPTPTRRRRTSSPSSPVVPG